MYQVTGVSGPTSPSTGPPKIDFNELGSDVLNAFVTFFNPNAGAVQGANGVVANEASPNQPTSQADMQKTLMLVGGGLLIAKLFKII